MKPVAWHDRRASLNKDPGGSRPTCKPLGKLAVAYSPGLPAKAENNRNFSKGS